MSLSTTRLFLLTLDELLLLLNRSVVRLTNGLLDSLGRANVNLGIFKKFVLEDVGGGLGELEDHGEELGIVESTGRRTRGAQGGGGKGALERVANWIHSEVGKVKVS